MDLNEQELLEILGEEYVQIRDDLEWQDFHYHRNGIYTIVYDNEGKGFGYTIFKKTCKCKNRRIGRPCCYAEDNEKNLHRDVMTFEEAADLVRADIISSVV